jgi:hypothetical protein
MRVEDDTNWRFTGRPKSIEVIKNVEGPRPAGLRTQLEPSRKPGAARANTIKISGLIQDHGRTGIDGRALVVDERVQNLFVPSSASLRR